MLDWVLNTLQTWGNILDVNAESKLQQQFFQRLLYISKHYVEFLKPNFKFRIGGFIVGETFWFKLL